jgi:hypothetical protein
MLLILYIVQAICNQILPPGTPTQLEQILQVFCFYLKYISYSNIVLDIFLMTNIYRNKKNMEK